ncbi:hypothetical protein ACFX15_037925 [Malus domestica]
MEADTAVEVGLSLIKQLASCNKSSRDRALRGFNPIVVVDLLPAAPLSHQIFSRQPLLLSLMILDYTVEFAFEQLPPFLALSSTLN